MYLETKILESRRQPCKNPFRGMTVDGYTRKSGVSNSDKVIDSRDVIARIEDLVAERDSLLEAINESSGVVDADEYSEDESVKNAHLDALQEAKDALKEWDEDDETGGELKALQNLTEDCEGYASDWRHGATLISEGYWVEYVEEMLKDCGDLPKNIPHYIEIDWEATAKNIAVDYSQVDYAGETYYIRAS